MAELKFEITKSIGILSESAKGWHKESTWLAGITGKQSTTFESGTLIMKK